MGLEVNLDSIRALEKQIQEGKGDAIKLKRARNSLLNISTRVPPEVLGHIFVWILFREAGYSLDSPGRFDGLPEGSYNFLLVCHHWFEVASRTPELWSFWGDTIQDWKNLHHRSRSGPLDLVLYEPGYYLNNLGGPLRDALRSRVVQGNIRQVHLVSYDHDTLTSIISSLTPNGEGGQNENIESIDWQNEGFGPVDASNFFSQSRLSRLCLLDLCGSFRISSWDGLGSRTTLLTALSLDLTESPPSSTPTTSHLLSILTSNPNLRELRLSGAAIPNDADGSTSKVSLRNLKSLSLTGEVRRLFKLLHRLILPQALDEINLSGSNPTVEDVSQTLAPYMRGYFRRDTRFQNPLEVSSSSSFGIILISVGVVCARATAGAPRVSLTVVLRPGCPPDVVEQFFVNLAAPIPREPVVSFTANLNVKLPEDLLVAMPNIETLTIWDVELSKGFLQPDPDGPHAEKKLLPSLRSLSLGDITVEGGNWGHLTGYLAHQTSNGQIISLRLFGDFPYIRSEVVNEIKNLVGEVIYDQSWEGRRE